MATPSSRDSEIQLLLGKVAALENQLSDLRARVPTATPISHNPERLVVQMDRIQEEMAQFRDFQQQETLDHLAQVAAMKDHLERLEISMQSCTKNTEVQQYIQTMKAEYQQDLEAQQQQITKLKQWVPGLLTQEIKKQQQVCMDLLDNAIEQQVLRINSWMKLTSM